MISLLSCGYRYVHPEGITVDRPQGAGNYAFVFFKNRSEIVLNGKRAIVERDSYILYRPSTPQYYRESELPFVNDWFHCEGEEMESLLAELRFPLDAPVQASDPQLVSRSIIELHRIQKMGGPLAGRIIDSEIRTLVMKLSNLYEMSLLTEMPGRYFRQLSELRNELYNEPQKHYSVEKLASGINLSKSYFQHLYKDLFGCSVVTDMINGRLEYAKYMLQNSTFTVSEIAAMCGYKYETHFMRQFKKFIGVTPGQYKASLSKRRLDREAKA